MSKTRAAAIATGVGTVGAALWWRAHPSPCPYWQRFWVQAPHPGITRKRLLEALEPRPGEQVLEIGPGTGYYSFDVASRLGDGKLVLFDIQQQMLDHITQRAAEAGVSNMEAVQGDAQALPFEDDSLDAAYLVTVLGEIPDQDAAVREIARVLKPGGRLVVGEMFGDPHYVSFGSLSEKAASAGLGGASRIGNPLAYFACLHRDSVT